MGEIKFAFVSLFLLVYWVGFVVWEVFCGEGGVNSGFGTNQRTAMILWLKRP